MLALQLHRQAPIAAAPLNRVNCPRPTPAAGSVLIRVRACGVCHTDLHIVEGDLLLHKQPITPGHQVVGLVEQVGSEVQQIRVGDRVGVPWLQRTCGKCEFCQRGEENLCDRATFTGWDVDGGYADYVIAHESAVVPIPGTFSDAAAAPLLCAGIIGYRSLRKAEVQPGEHLGLFGFGGSAHIAIQIARHWGCSVSVFTRGVAHQRLAAALGASWAGGLESSPNRLLDRAILFAPVGSLVPIALSQLRKGGTLAVNAIHLSPIPEFGYNLLYGERTVRSVTNATHADAAELLSLAAQIPIQTEVVQFDLSDANEALLKLKQGAINGAAVLVNA
jgi:propanol-preferring alcohol dehydrogenase